MRREPLPSPLMPLSAVFHTDSLQEQVAALGDAFAIAGEFLHCDTINSGHINMTFRATYRKMDGTTDRYIFQRVNDAVFPCPRDVMHNVEKVTNHIRWKMLRVLKTPFRQTLNLYSARGGRKYLEIPGSGFWRCYNCIESTHTFDVAEHPRQAYEAARAFGALTGCRKRLPGTPAGVWTPAGGSWTSSAAANGTWTCCWTFRSAGNSPSESSTTTPRSTT